MKNLIPECVDMYVSGLGEVKFINCSFGIDWWVEHNIQKVRLIIQDGNEITTKLKDYIRAVIKFRE